MTSSLETCWVWELVNLKFSKLAVQSGKFYLQFLNGFFLISLAIWQLNFQASNLSM